MVGWSEMADAEEGVVLPAIVTGADEVPILFANVMVVQHQQNEFVISFCQATPPLTLGPPEAQAEQIRAMPYVPVKVVARVGVTPERLQELISILQVNYANWEKKAGRS